MIGEEDLHKGLALRLMCQSIKTVHIQITKLKPGKNQAKVI
jgi:hypothetical protein